MSEPRRGQRFAFIMDTRLCDAAFALADQADMLVCESTFADTEAALAQDYGHLTARQAGRIAAEAGARLLVLTHFSQRYDPADGQRLAGGGGQRLRRRGRPGPGPVPDPGSGPGAASVIRYQWGQLARIRPELPDSFSA